MNAKLCKRLRREGRATAKVFNSDDRTTYVRNPVTGAGMVSPNIARGKYRVLKKSLRRVYSVAKARTGIPSAKPGAFTSPKPGRTGVIHAAAIVFGEKGAQAASLSLGGSLRAKILLPKVWARAKWLARCEKRIQEATAIEASRLALLKEAA